MAKLIAYNLILFFVFLSSFSCMNIPIEFKLNKTINIGESVYLDEANSFKNQLLKLVDLGKASKPQACEEAFTTWVLDQIAIGLIPDRVVTSLEYGKESRDPLIGRCNSVDLSEKVPAAYKKLSERAYQELPAVFFNIRNFREDLASIKCSKDYLDPKKRKLALLGMRTLSSINTLNISSPVYNIYYTTKKINESQINEVHAEENLLAKGDIKKFGQTRSFAPGFKGASEIDLITNTAERKAAIEAFNNFETDLVAFPAPFNPEPSKTMVADLPQFLIPKGKLIMKIEIDMEVNAEIKNIRCALKNWREF